MGVPVAALTWVLVLAPPAHAQPTEGDVALARARFQQGVLAAEDRDWERARAMFDESYVLSRNARVLINLATAEAELGRLVDAIAHYREYLERETSSRATAQRSQVLAAIASLEARVGRMRVDAPGLLDDDTITVDDEPFDRAALGTVRVVDPGVHTLTIRRGGAVLVTRSVEVGRGSSAEVTVVVPAPPVAEEPPPIVVAPVAPRSVPPPRPSLADDTSGSVFTEAWFWIAVGVVLAAGTTSAVLAVDREGPPPPGYVGTLGRFVVME